MVRKIVIEWNYEPPNYFEEKMVVEHDGHELLIDDGHAEVTLDPKYIDEVDVLIDQFSADLESRFLAVQVMTHEPFQLSKPSRYDVNEDGTINHYLKLETLTLTASVGKVDFKLIDADGNIVSNTKQERIRKKKWFSDLTAKYGEQNRALKQMLRSYNASVSDPDNEFIYLYEIRDAAVKEFSDDSKTKAALNITNTEWRDFGQITCYEPLRQGRHRGWNFDQLRDATSQELEWVRKIAAKIIENYMIYLENKGT